MGVIRDQLMPTGAGVYAVRIVNGRDIGGSLRHLIVEIEKEVPRSSAKMVMRRDTAAIVVFE